MISAEEIAELAPYYEEYLYAVDPKAAAAVQSRLLYFAGCKKVYEREPEEIRNKFDLNAYIATFITEELLRYLQQRDSKYPTIQPEKRPPS